MSLPPEPKPEPRLEAQTEAILNARDHLIKMVLDRIDGVGENVRDLRQELNTVPGRQAAIEIRLAALRTDVDMLNEIVRDGATHPSLLTQVAQLQTTIQRRDQLRLILWSVYATIGAALITVAAALYQQKRAADVAPSPPVPTQRP